MKWSFGVIVSLAVAAIAGQAFAAVDAFLQLDGIQGESHEKPGAIELKSWSYATGHGALEGASLGRGADSPTQREIIVVKLHDQSSPKLMKAASTGQHFQHATLFVRKAGAQPYLEYRLEDVIISHYSVATGAAPTESLTLNFAKIETIDQPQAQSPTAGERAMLPSSAHLPPPGN
jgi:type VI protein secretion system component Hcp